MNAIILIFIFLFGLIIGSFLNCLIWRLRKKESIMGRSYCPECRQQIAWYDNMPVLSFLLLRGKCRHCHKKISWQYPAVELITGILFVAVFIKNAFSSEFIIHDSLFIIQTVRDCFLISVMIIIFIYDLRWYLILDSVTIPAAIIIFFLNLLFGFNLWNLAISVIIGGSFFLIQFLISQGKWIGGGDIRLGVLMGAALGWPYVLLAIFISYLIGSAVGVGLMLAGKKQMGSKVPLGTFLAVGTVITLFLGEKILAWYL
ncbi:prepilin peptidase [Candidatus Falkowbacteria bacterium CG_4_9_14_3_um_filter_36_9]|nr:MAG: prepilin peptidase [Candidatus Falkowbacteria bacterium CG_4_10_14_0_2_um_filter_36_22]PJB18266.1 MAG: prepilin peptidase [Candidatus Falkowbacteria bacterium CG_4_9_14_3_um_filter_36_9]